MTSPQVSAITLNENDMPSHTLCDNGCLREFPRKTQPGLCQRCKRQNVEGITDAEAEKIACTPQCTLCGVISDRMPYKNPFMCGPCLDATNGTPPQETNSALATQARLRFKTPGVPPPPPSARLASTPVQPTVNPHSEAIKNITQAPSSSSTSPKIRMYFPVFINGKLAQEVGIVERSVDENDYLETFISQSLTTINSLTTETYPQGYERRNVLLRGLKGRIPPVEDSSLMTVGEFYKALQKNDVGSTFITCYPSKPKPSGRYIHGQLQIFVNKEKANPAGGSKKRKATAIPDDERSGKKPGNNSTVLRRYAGTMVRPSTATQLVTERSSKVKIRIAQATWSTQGDGDYVEIAWDDTVRSAWIEKKRTSNGTMKNVFKGTIIGPDDLKGTWAFKRYYKVSQDGHKPSLQENQTELNLDLDRTSQGAFALSAFFEAAAEQKVKVYTQLEFARNILVEEVIETDADSPSIASGVTREEWEAAPDSERRIIWLAEPFNPSAPERFTGTMQFLCNKEDLLSSTIEAFVHFAHYMTQGGLIFCDIEGMRGRLSSGGSGMLLFDTMTHSHNAGETGAGDHGIEGHIKYAEQHECNNICVALGLDREDDLAEVLEKYK